MSERDYIGKVVGFEDIGFGIEEVNVALESEPGNEELMKLKTDLLEVISLEEELVATSEAETAAANVEIQGTSVPDKPKIELIWKVGEKCMAPASNGQKYLAVIDGFTKENAAVTFVGKGTKHMVKTEELGVAKIEVPKKYVWAKSDKGNQHRKTEWQMERERRRSRAQKKDQRLKEMELVKEDEKNKWLNFNAKASSRSMKGFKRPTASGSAPDGPAWGLSAQTSVSSRRDFGAFKSTQRGNMDSLF